MIPHLTVIPLLTAGEAASHVTAEELAEAAAFGSEHRRRERLTWRAAARRMLGGELRIAYDAVGAPVALGRPERLSVSHAADRAAVLVADGPCAVDLERCDRNFSRVLSRCLTPFEQQLSDDPLFPAAVWCTKECLYKYGHDRTLVLREDLRIEGFERIGGDEGAWGFGTFEAFGPGSGRGQVGAAEFSGPGRAGELAAGFAGGAGAAPNSGREGTGTVDSEPAAGFGAVCGEPAGRFGIERSVVVGGSTFGGQAPILVTAVEPLVPYAVLTARIRGGELLRLIACRLGPEYLLVYLV